MRTVTILGVLLALTMQADAKPKRAKAPKAKATPLTTLQKPEVRLPKCTVTPQAPELTLEEAREVVWEAYQTTKVDRQKKGKNIFDEYFGVKDEWAAKRLDVSLQEYVLRVRQDVLINAARMFIAFEADTALRVGVTSAYRDPWRQEKATGTKSAKYSSYHGSRPELGGVGIALDVAAYSDDGDRLAQLRRNPLLYAWIDKYGKLFKLGRPYGNRDAPHIGPTNGKEYIAKRGSGELKVAKTKHKYQKLGRKIRTAQDRGIHFAAAQHE